jgi:hypothetical protein
MACYFAAGALAVLSSQAVAQLLREEWEVRTSYYKTSGHTRHSFRTTMVFDDREALGAYMAYTRQDPHTTALVWHKPRWHMCANVCATSQFQ